MKQDNFLEFYNYCTQPVNMFLYYSGYGAIEAQYLKLYVSLRMLRNPMPYINLIMSLFHSLPIGKNYSTIVNKLQEELIFEMMPYYIHLQLDVNDLINRWNK